jgi:hypothetical protein
MNDAVALLLIAAFRHTIREPNIEAAFERFSDLTTRVVSYEAFCDAVTACLREDLIREPIRLPEGALQCHWHLELAPKGVNAARQLLGCPSPPPNLLPQGEGESVRSSPSPCGRGLGGGDNLQPIPLA